MTKPEQFVCEGCGREHVWRAQFAGKSVKCGCGHVMTAPSSVPDESDDLYDLAPDIDAVPPAPQPGGSVVASGPTLSGALDYQRVDQRAHDTDLYFPDPVKDLYLPLALIAGGTVIQMGIGLFAARGGVNAAMGAAFYVGIKMIIDTVLMLIAIYVVAWIREISFGPVPTAILKLCAISIGPGAVASLLGAMFWFVPFSGLIAWIIGFVLYFALIGALFDLDESDTWWCVLTVLFVKLLVVFVLLRIALFI